MPVIPMPSLLHTAKVADMTVAANSSEYVENLPAPTAYDDDSDRDVYRALRAGASDRRECKRNAAHKAMVKLAPHFESLGVLIRASGGDVPHTYEVFHDGRRLMWWWPSKGKTRIGSVAGDDVLSAKSLLEYVRVLVSGTPPLSMFTFANWVASHIDGAAAWQPGNAKFARVYKGESYIHINHSSISYKNAGDLAEEVRALLALHRVSTTAAGYVVGPAAEIAPLT